MRVLVTGGRDYKNADHVCNVLGQLQPQPTVIIAGKAKGVDTFAEQYADGRAGCRKEIYPADWFKYGKAAGLIRNQQMLDEGHPDLVVAFPGGRGTADMVARAKAAKIEVKEINW